jgi:cytoskeletal protein RodZ
MAVEAGGIGARLRAGREKLGLTVLQVAERIHTDPKIVEAIETENYEALGAPVYARGHIRHYAELVGESGSELNQLYSNLSKVAQPDLTRIVKAPAGTNSSKLVAPALLVIAVFAVAGAIWWVSALSKKKPQLSDTHVVGDEVTAPGGSSPGVDSSGTAGTSASTQEPGQVGSPTTSADHGPPAGAMAMQARPGSTPPGAMAMQGRPGQAGSTSAGAMTMQPRPGQAGSTPAGAMAMQGRPGQQGSPPPGAMAMHSRQGNIGPGGATSGSVAPAPGRSGTAGSQAATSAQARAASGSGAASGGSARSVPASQASRTSSSSGSASAQTRSAAAQTRTASATPAAAGAATSEPATATPSAAPPRAKNQSQVTLRYSADSWTEVYDASGARLFYDVGAANSVQTVVGTPPLRVVLGNASGVSVEYNGHNKPIAKLSRPDGSVQFSINRSGKVVRAKPVADGG